MSVKIQPSGTLGFHRPLTQLVKRTLTVSNPNSQPVAFKVKTTAPKQYCVRPNSGRIEPGEQVEVQVLLQPMQVDPELDAKCRDKFLVQSAIITPERESRPLNELWSMIDKEDKESISEHKIRCAYLPPLDADADTSRTVNSSSSAHQLPASQNGFGETAKEVVGGVAAGVGATSVADKLAHHDGAEGNLPPAAERSAPSPPLDSSRDSHPRTGSEQTAPFKSAIAAPIAAGAATAASALGLKSTDSLNDSSSTAPRVNGTTTPTPSTQLPVAPTMTTTSSDAATTQLQSELAEAKREIERLKTQLAEAQAGLRQRQVTSSSLHPSSSASNLKGAGEIVVQGETGIPLQTVMMAIGITFVVTWLFF